MRAFQGGATARGVILVIAIAACAGATSIATSTAFAAPPPPPPAPQNLTVTPPGSAVPTSGAIGRVAEPTAPSKEELAKSGVVVPDVAIPTARQAVGGTAVKPPPMPSGAQSTEAAPRPAGLDISGVVGSVPEAAPALSPAELAASTGVKAK
jgi:hypothetical protein